MSAKKNGLFKKVLSVMLLIILVFSGCQPKTDEKLIDELDKNVSLNLRCLTTEIFAGSSADEDYAPKYIVDEFKKMFPNVTLVIDVVGKDDLLPTIMEAKDSETPIDIILATPFEIHFLTEQLKFLDLSDIFRGVKLDEEENESSDVSESSKDETDETDEVLPEKLQMPENILKIANISGTDKKEFYPIAVSADLMAFNKNIIEKAGLLDKIPTGEDRAWTFEEYQEFLELLDEKLPNDVDTGVFYYGTEESVSGTQRLVSNAYGQDFFDEDLVTINSENGIKALKAVKKIVDEQNIVNGFTMDINENIKKFINGETAHTIYYNLGLDIVYKKDKKDDFETIFVPYPSSSTAKLDFQSIGVSVVESEDKDKNAVAKEFIKFIGDNDEITSYLVGSMGMYSPYDDYNGFLQDEYAYLRKTLPLMDEYNFSDNSNANDQWVFALRKIMFLDEKIEDSLKYFEENFDKNVLDANEESSDD